MRNFLPVLHCPLPGLGSKLSLLRSVPPEVGRPGGSLCSVLPGVGSKMSLLGIFPSKLRRFSLLGGIFEKVLQVF